VEVGWSALFEAKPHAAMGTLLRRMADNLGLIIAGAARNRWILPTPTDQSSSRSARPITATVRPSGHRSSRDRFRLVPPSDAS
jgi:hypothetical protein